MSSLPTGEVTLLFTDIDGSTRLLNEIGDGYAGVLAEHRRVLRDVFRRHGGVEVDTQGDAFFVAFAGGDAAAAAASDAQRALREGPVAVRMGIHTGRPQVTAEGYVGIDVHRGARIAAAGHGGQVLVSRPTADALREAGFDVRDLGEHRLKDLVEPEWLFQLMGAGLALDFPPLRTLGNTNLPAPGWRLIDREQVLGDVCRALRSGEVRMITLTGTGGTGKTRLAIQAGRELVEHFPNGVFFVSLASLNEAAQVIPAVAQTLGVREQPGAPLVRTLAEHLAMRRLLLVLDNFEHVVGAAPDVAELIGSAAGLSVLATSREPVRIDAEQEQPLAPLGQPDAVELFGERGRAVVPDFEPDATTAEICRRLDCLPLAIELAAARVRLLPPVDMLARLEHTLPLLTGGARDAPSRQRTLRATIDWSYDLLTEDERLLFRSLSVFAGGCDLEAVETVCAGDLDVLESLVQKSLVLQRPGLGGSARFLMLATVREYARERLAAAGEQAGVRARHAGHVLALVRRAEPHLLAAGQVEWLARLEQEIGNIRAAVGWLLSSGGESEALRIVSTLIDFWDVRGSHQEARGWLERGLAALADRQDPIRGPALLAAGCAAFQFGEVARARTLTLESLAFAEAAGDARVEARALSHLAGVAMAEGAFAETVDRAAGAVAAAERAGDRAMRAFALNMLAVGTYELGDPDAAKRRFAEADAILAEIGDRRDLAILRGNRAGAALLEGDYPRARELFEEALALARQVNERGRLPAYAEGLGAAALLGGDPGTAVSQLSIALAAAREVGDTGTVLSTLAYVAATVGEHGDPATAGVLWGAADRAAERLGIHRSGDDVLVEPLIAAAAARAGSADWERALVRGRQLELEDAVDAGLRALGELGPAQRPAS
jgi:predicted ATPase/class 3 adenylate cyclase